MQRDFVALQWVTGEIEQAARQLGTELLGFADNLSDPTRLRHALTLAHQIRATLRMLNIPSAEQLAQESELLVQAMLHGQIPPSEEILQVLLAAGLQLPAYLRRIAQEQRELPLDVIDTTNALRTARGEAALPQPELELPGEFPELFEETGEGTSDASAEDVQLLRQARQRFQAELLGLLKKDSPEERLHALGRVFGSLAQRLRPGGQRLMWQACAAACDAVPRGTLDAADPLIACLRKVDEEFRELMALEQGFFRRRPSENLFRDLLAIIADSLPATPGLIELQQRYRLLPVRTAPDGAVLEDLGATATVVGALSSELSAVLGKLEGTEGDAVSTGLALREVEPDLRRIATVLAGLGYRSEESLLSGHLAELSAGISGGADAEEHLTAITTALLDLDQRLAERVVRAGGDTGEAAARRHPLERAREAVCREVQLGLELAKQTVADFSLSDGDVQLLSPLPERLNAMAGALDMAGLQGAAGILASARDYTRAVRDAIRPAPGVEEIDALADALSSVEYFMERLVIDGKPADLILVRAQAALRRVVPDVPPVVSARPVPRAEAVALAEAASAHITEAAAPAPIPETLVSEQSAPPADVGGEPAPAAAFEAEAEHEPEPEPVTASMETLLPLDLAAEPPAEPEAPIEGEELEPEILEIFVEEATEVLQTIATQLPLWRAVPAPGPALTELRRAFHTLKGSGRMVGAAVIGELAWSIENLLNRVIERMIEPGPAVLDMVEHAQALMPSLVDAFANRRPPDAAAATRLGEAAFAIARGETQAVPAPEPVDIPATTAEALPEPEREADITEAALPPAEELPLEGEAAEPPVATETVDLPVAEPETAEAQELPELPAFEPVQLSEEPGETADILPEMAFDAAPEPEPELEPQETTDIAGEDWLPEPEPVADAEVSIEDWLPELEPAELVAAVTDEAAAEESVSPGVDAGVRGIFAEEAMEHLASVRAWLHAGRDTADDALVRSVHTLRGGAHVAGLAELGALLDHLDASVRAAGGSGRALVAAERDLLDQLCPLLEDHIGCGMLPDADLLARTRALAEHAAASVETAGAETAADAQAEARLARFLEEALERLFHARSLLGAWRSSAAHQADREHLVAELRTIHQRAEQLGVTGVTPLSGLMLAAASSLAEPAEQGTTLLDTGIEAFLDALDRLAAGQQPQPEQQLLDALAALAARSVEAAPEKAVQPALAAADAEPLRARIARELQQAEPELLGIFLEEAAELLASIDQSIDDWRHDRNDRAPFERLQRDLHTLKGGARMAGLRHLGELSHNLETFLINQGVQFGSFDDAFFQRVLEQHEQVLAVMDLVRGGAPVADIAPAAAETDTHDAAPEALTVRERIARDLAKADPDLLGIFLEEAEELMASVDAGIDAWRGARGNRAIFDKLQRDLHTLKGGARMAGISVLGDLAHEFESMLIAAGGDLSALPDAFFLRVADFHEQLARAMDTVRARPVPGMPEPAAVAVVETAAPEFPATVPEEAAALEPVAALAPESPTPARIAVTPHTPAPAPAAAKPRDEVVRVSSQLLEDLVNLAGETSISRGRVEEQVSELGKLFEDMQSTIERLQGQVRRLDIATEAQILFRRERAETAGTEGFDPLEMDRYSQLQQLSRSLVESASDILDIKRTLAEKARDLETVLIQQSRINSQLQEGLMRSRMVPFSSILPRIRRVVRQVATELDKSVELELGKMDGELDRGILERIVAPLEHMLRNAVDHGIEPRERRIAAGKDPTGHIHIDISREGGDVLLALSDDGAGVNIAAVRGKAIERGLMSADSLIGDHEITQFILHSGFSTAEKVTQISGRGVGMDVVSSEIRQMGGSLEIHSAPGKGSRFVIRLPFTVSVSRSLMVIVGSDTYALPLNTVEGVVRMPVTDMARYTGPEAELLSYAGQQYAVRHLGQLLYPGEQRDLVDTGENVPVVLVRAGGQALAVEVDRLVGAREIVVKSLGPQFGAVPGLSGATVLGDGSVVLILDIPAMLRADSARGAQRAVELARPEVAPEAEHPPLVMVVDDSVTVRKVTTRFLEREGMRVISAKDGAEAMVMLGEQVPDIMLLDIEMPHMDGFEVLSKLRLSDTLRQLPVIMITSRTGDKHRERALSLGANMYLGKPYQESVLLGHIRQLLAAARQAAGG